MIKLGGFMEKIALFATDLDGTLFYDRQNINERDKNTLKKLKEQGCIICFATGASVKKMRLSVLRLWATQTLAKAAC